MGDNRQRTTKPGPMPATTDLNASSYGVYSWSPDPEPGRTPPTAVVLAISVAGYEGQYAVRLNSRRAVEEMVETLREHANDVWGGDATRIAEAAEAEVARVAAALDAARYRITELADLLARVPTTIEVDTLAPGLLGDIQRTLLEVE